MRTQESGPHSIPWAVSSGWDKARKWAWGLKSQICPYGPCDLGQWLHSPPEPQSPYLPPGYLHASPRVDGHIRQEMELKSTSLTAKCCAYHLLIGTHPSKAGWPTANPPWPTRSSGPERVPGRGATVSEVGGLASPWDRVAAG